MHLNAFLNICVKPCVKFNSFFRVKSWCMTRVWRYQKLTLEINFVAYLKVLACFFIIVSWFNMLINFMDCFSTGCNKCLQEVPSWNGKRLLQPQTYSSCRWWLWIYEKESGCLWCHHHRLLRPCRYAAQCVAFALVNNDVAIDSQTKHGVHFRLISFHPVTGPAESLFKVSYYQLMKTALCEGGILSCQGWYNCKSTKKAQCKILMTCIWQGCNFYL